MSARTTDGDAPRPLPWRWLALLLAVAFALRLGVILAPPPDLFERGAVPHEELLRGIAAQEFIDGPLAPIQDYQVNNFWGGSLVVSLLAVPCYLVLGPTVVAMRLPTVLFGLGAVLFAFLLLDRFASRRAAWIGAWLLAVAPPGYTISGCTVYGTHLESNTLALLLAWLYLDWARHDRSGLRRGIVFGVCSGFALWFGYGLLVVFAAMLAFEFSADKLFFLRRGFLVFAAAFVIGFSPWIRYSLTHAGGTLDVYDVSIGEHFWLGLESGQTLQKLGDFFARDWAESFWFQHTFGFDGLWLGRALEVALLLLVVFAAWRERANLSAALRSLVSFRKRATSATPTSFSLVFLVLFLVAYTATDFVIGGNTWVQSFRYLMPVWPFVAVLSAVALDDLAGRSARSLRAVQVGFASLLVVFALGTVLRCDTSKIRSNWSTPGYATEYFVRFLVLRFGENPEVMTEIVGRLERDRPRDERDRIYRGVANGLRILSHAQPGESPAAISRALHSRAMLSQLSVQVGEPHRGLFFQADDIVPLPR